MAGDNFKRVSVGQALDDVLTADVLNELMDIVRDRRLGKQLGGPKDGKPLDRGVVQVKNMSGFARKRWDVLAFSQYFPEMPLFRPLSGQTGLSSFRERPNYVQGVVPEWPYGMGNFCVLQEPLADGAIGTAVVDGLCPVWIDPTDLGPSRRWFDIAEGDPDEPDDEIKARKACGPLEARMMGGAELLWHGAVDGTEFDDGRHAALVRIGAFHNEPFLAEIDADLAEGAEVDAAVLEQYQDGTWAGTSENVKVRWALPVTSGKVGPSNVWVQGNRRSGCLNVIQSTQFYLSKESATHMAAFRPGDQVECTTV